MLENPCSILDSITAIFLSLLYAISKACIKIVARDEFKKIILKKTIIIKTDYGNKYTVELQLNNTVIMYKNGSRVYSTNK